LAFHAEPAFLISLYGQILGSVVFCFVFYFLWRESSIAFFRYWSVAWVAQSAALLWLWRYFSSGQSLFLYPYTFFGAVFAVSLVAAAGLRTRAFVELLIGISLVLILAFSLGLHHRFEAYHVLHGLGLGIIYLYSCFAIRGKRGIGGKLFFFTLVCLVVFSLHYAAVFFYIDLRHNTPDWAAYLQYKPVYDFCLQTLLGFSATTMWIERQYGRLQELGDELARVHEETSTKLDRDPLTGLLNHSALSKRMENDEGFTGVVSVCDVDNFKDVNDRYGHLAGDEVLRNVGQLIRSLISTDNEAFRWGGDEFVILFRNENWPLVKDRMGAIQQRLRNFRVRGHGSVPITFSWGTADVSGRSLREAVDAADQDMYSSKRQRTSRGV
jgi:diguanylate cyclase (GGDEF)-like protein